MTITTFTLLILLAAYVAGIIGSMTGLGGAVIFIPLLTLIFHVDLHYVIGASFIASIATSSGSASAYVKEGIANIRIGMFLEIATTAGALTGAIIAAYMPIHTIGIIFGFTLMFSSIANARKKTEHIELHGSKLANFLKLNGTYPTNEGKIVHYGVKNVAGGFSIMLLAGVLSGLLGVGSGSLKVLAMDGAMRLPFKVSTTTSNFMIGVTAATGAVVYLQRGYVVPGIAFPIIVGVLLGAFTGSKLLTRANTKFLRVFFSIALFLVAVEMVITGFRQQF